MNTGRQVKGTVIVILRHPSGECGDSYRVEVLEFVGDRYAIRPETAVIFSGAAQRA